MNVLFTNEFGMQKVMITNHIPRVGDHVDVFHKPMPEVKKVVWYPQDEELNKFDVVVLL